MQILDWAEYEHKMRKRLSQVPDFRVIVVDGTPGFLVPRSCVKANHKKREITWEAQLEILGLHGFLLVETGKRKKKKLTLPLCLVSREGRALVSLLLNTVNNEGQGRFLLAFDVGEGTVVAEITLDLKPLVVVYLMSTLMPTLEEFRMAPDCPFCENEK